MRSCGICLSVSGLFHLVQRPPGSSTWSQMAGSLSFLRLHNIPLYIMHQILFIPSPTDGCLGCFHILAIISNAVINMGLQIALGDTDFTSRKQDPPLQNGCWSGSEIVPVKCLLPREDTGQLPKWLEPFRASSSP